MAGLSFLGPDGCALVQRFEDGMAPPLHVVTPLQIVLTPDDCKRIARWNRARYTAERSGW